MKIILALLDDRTGTELASINVKEINKSIDISKYPTATRMRIRVNRDLDGVEVSGTCYPVISNSPVDAYVPCDSDALVIPDEVLSLEGYGDGIDENYYNYIDFENKKFIKKVASVDMGTLNFNVNSVSTPSVYACKISNMKAPITSIEKLGGILSKKYGISAVSSVGGMGDKTMYRTTGAYLLVRDDDFVNDESGFKNSLIGEMLYYELSEPIITDISEYITNDNFIKVFGKGTIIAENDNGLDVPTTITYQIKGVTT